MFRSCSSNSHPLFSVLSICKDSLHDFKLTLDSLLPISHSIELICVVTCDPQYVQGYMSAVDNFPSYKVNFNIDSGLYDAMNICLMHKSSFTPFIFLNSGDILCLDTIPFLLQTVSSIPPSHIYCFESYLSKKSLFTSDMSTDVYRSHLQLREPKSLFLKSIYRFFKFPCHQSILYGSFFSTIRFNSISRISADIFFNSDAFRLSSCIKYFPLALTIFNLQGISSTSSSSSRLLDRLKILKTSPLYLFDIRILSGTVFLFFRTSFHFFFSR